MFKRKTTTYKVEVRTITPLAALDNMLERVPVGVTVAASGHHLGVAHIRFRCASNDNLALNIAREIAGPCQFVLATGYGVNQREVEQ